MSLLLRAQTTARAWARRAGVTPLLSRARSVFPRQTSAHGYEALFSDALLSSVRPGDRVWDVGANLGFYTQKLSERVGPQGEVCAFEPAPACFARIQALALPNVRLFNVALGDTDAALMLALSEDPLGSTHSLTAWTDPRGESMQVSVRRADRLAQEHGLAVPNVIKLDVEGFEEEVLTGMGALLEDPACRALLCEIHFELLEVRGQRHAPSRIEAVLRGHAFHTRWIDASHLSATRSESSGQDG